MKIFTTNLPKEFNQPEYFKEWHECLYWLDKLFGPVRIEPKIKDVEWDVFEQEFYGPKGEALKRPFPTKRWVCSIKSANDYSWII